MPQTDDKEIWSVYAKGVKPLGKSGRPAPDSSKQKKDNSPSAPEKPVVRTQKPHKQHTANKTEPVVFDRRTERRMRQGEVKIDARLDLHGMRQDEAHRALDRFMERYADHSRCLLIITGKGRGGSGVLRARLADWLEASPHAAHILSLRPAAIKHGGSGAFYVVLRWQKNQ